VSSASTSGASSGASSGTSGRGALVIILAVIGVLAIIAGILYVSGAANSIHFMVSVRHGHHQVRAIVAFVIGIACLIGAYIAWTRPAGRRASASAAGGGSAGASGSPGPDTSGSAGPSESGSASPSGS
jgi:hypothetical protein